MRTYHICMMLVLLAGGSAAQTLDLSTADPMVLIRVRDDLRSGSKTFVPAYRKLGREAEAALDYAPVSVMDKERIPPSGDKHDYLSQGRYWWADPDAPDGVPYIRRDGEVNPEAATIPDHENLSTMSQHVETLALMYFFSGEERFARHAARLIRVWFLDSLTRMNPHLRFGQSVPGRSDDRGAGVLEGRRFPLIIDAATILRTSQSWTPEDHESLRAWFAEYLTWVTESKKGKAEARAANNHGTWYDQQVIPVAAFAGKRDLAYQMAREIPGKRIFSQIEPDGTQPHELQRTRSWHYCIFNLDAFVRLSVIARQFGISLWDSASADGRSLGKAIDVLLPYALGEQSWEHQDIAGFEGILLAPALLASYAGTGNEDHLRAARKLAGRRLTTDRRVLTFGIRP